jgi:hypothetical protein
LSFYLESSSEEVALLHLILADYGILGIEALSKDTKNY